MIRTKQGVRKARGLSSLTTAIVGVTCGFALATSSPAQAQGKIVAMETESASPDIIIMNSDGSNSLNLNNDNQLDQDPAISALGNKIAWLQNDQTLWVMNSDGSNKTALLHLFSPEGTAVNSDGTKIAFDSLQPWITSGFMKIHIVNSNGRGEVVLNNIPNHCRMPAFSPDGTKIVFAGGSSFDTNAISIVNTDGTGLTTLINDGSFKSNPSFSPDGTQIVFDSALPSYPDQHEVYVIPVSGGTATRITAYGGWDPCFSPDGSKIAFQNNVSSKRDICTLNAVPESPTNMRLNITTSHAMTSVVSPSWGN